LKLNLVTTRFIRVAQSHQRQWFWITRTSRVKTSLDAVRFSFKAMVHHY